MKNKDHKTVWKLFTIADWEKEQNYLRAQHKAGWKFDRVDFHNRYHFTRCKPEDVVYQLDYNPDGLAHKEEYVQMFADCGWEYLQDYVGYSYFRKPVAQMNGKDEEIFCDDASRLDMLRRVFNGRMVPALIVLLLCIMPNIPGNLQAPTRDSVTFLVLSLILFLIYGVVFGNFALQYWKLRRGERK